MLSSPTKKTIIKIKWASAVLLVILGCQGSGDQSKSNDIEEKAANREVADYMQNFAGRGALSDESEKPSIVSSLDAFEIAEDLQIDVVLAEPDVTQPLEVNFDHKGRMWVVQYDQYPYPEGLKVTGIDHHIRMTFDKKPDPPPVGVKGADKITFFEDTDGDGVYDKSTDAITGLNIATGVTWGRGQIWVLNPPYLLAYPDEDDDGLPDGDPVVHVDGFGLEDTHAVANSLRWGPDGWLYGCQGSTTTAVINTKASKDVRFEGQAIWRYHTDRMVFEIFAEGGGNTFHVEIDVKGRVYSGTNGFTRGQYYKQGAYYGKNWGKHGALTNPYAFGYLSDMNFTGEKIRFTHAWIKYEGSTLPERYHNLMFAINPLQNYVQLSKFEPNGSTFATYDEGQVLTTDDRWFRPVDIKVGPDGAIYLADWCDSRLSHVDPRDTWHRQSGRIYRLGARDSEMTPMGDLSQLTSDSLLQLLSHPNKWYRQQAQRLLADRQDPGTYPDLLEFLGGIDDQMALEALWALYVGGGWDDDVALRALRHTDPFVRLWGTRFVGDDGSASELVSAALIELASVERHPEVLSQLSASARRLPVGVGLEIIDALTEHIDVEDPDNGLMLWWGLEPTMSGVHRGAVEQLFGNVAIWESPVVKKILLRRMMQKLILLGTPEDHQLAAYLFERAPGNAQGQPLMEGLLEGLRGQDMLSLPQRLLQAIKPYQSTNEGQFAMGLRRKDPEAVAQALDVVADHDAPLGERLSYIRILEVLALPGTVDALLKTMRARESPPAILKATLGALSAFEGDSIATHILDDYPNHLRADPGIRIAALYAVASRSSWAEQLMKRIQVQKEIHAEDVTHQIISQLKIYASSGLQQAVGEVWPDATLSSDEDKDQEILRIKEAVASHDGDREKGHSLYKALCATCHVLFDEGEPIGPELTGYDRQNTGYLALHIVDPNIDIREGYVNYEVKSKDGRIMTGMIKERTANQLVLKPVGGEMVTWAASQIDQLSALPVSIMPEKLTTHLSDKQVADMFAYIMQGQGL